MKKGISAEEEASPTAVTGTEREAARKERKGKTDLGTETDLETETKRKRRNTKSTAEDHRTDLAHDY